MNETKTLLEIGDVLYTEQFTSTMSKYIIDRVTAKRAFCGVAQFNRELRDNNMAAIIGPSKWGPYDGMLETPALKEKWNKIRTNQRVSFLSKYITNATTEDQRAIISILEKYESK